MMNEKLPLIGTAVAGVVVVVIGLMLTSGGWTMAMAVPFLILVAGLGWSMMTVVPHIPDASLPTQPYTHAGDPLIGEPPTDRPRPVEATAGTNPPLDGHVGSGPNGDVMTVEMATFNADTRTVDSSTVDAATVDRDTPARAFEFLPSELSGDPDRLQCPRCGRFEGVTIDDGRSSMACESCNAIFAVTPNAVSFVRMFDLGMFVVSDPLSVSPQRPSRPSPSPDGPAAPATPGTAGRSRRQDPGTN